MQAHKLGLLLLLFAATVVLPGVCAGAGRGYAMTLEGDPLQGIVESIDDSGKVNIDGRIVELEALRYIAPEQTEGGGPAVEAAESPLRIILVCGSDLRAKELAFNEEVFEFNSASAASRLEIPVDSVRAIRLALPIEGSRFEETLALEADQRTEDTVYVTGVAGELLELNCLIESIDADSVSFDRNGKKQTIARDKIHGVILASPDLDEPMPCRAIMDDRSTFAGQVASLSSGVLKLEMIDGIEIELPWENLRRLRVYSSRLVSVADLEPEEVKTQPILAPKWEFQRNRSVAGNELNIGGMIYEQGLGLAAGMEITYQLDGDFKLFTASIGIDAETSRRGDCEFVVRGDGREIFRQRVKGDDEASLVRIDVSGVDDLVLAVEPGVDLDISDHANWAEASLLQDGK
ncbi:MAG: NPCBM/NEW2 domain-containing protein [Verrucomicrobiales bacterium]